MDKLLKVVPLLVLLSACGGTRDTEIGPGQTAAAEAPILLGSSDVATITSQEVATGVRVTGSLDPAQRVDVKAQVAGQLQRVAVERGDAVRRGQLLALIDSGMQQAQSVAARAQLSAAERDFSAAETLFQAGAISERDYVNARTARDAARAQLSQIGQSIAQARITAPQSGIVTARNVETGESVMPGTTLVSIADVRRLELKGNIPASQVGSVRIGQRVRLTLEAYPGRQIEGRVDRVDAVADAETRQVSVHIGVDNAAGALVGGLFATGLIETGQATTSLNVPESAVVNGSVLEVSTGRIRRIPADAVRPGEQVIVTPRPELQEGQLVEVPR